jgi:hypothetical protein
MPGRHGGGGGFHPGHGGGGGFHHGHGGGGFHPHGWRGGGGVPWGGWGWGGGYYAAPSYVPETLYVHVIAPGGTSLFDDGTGQRIDTAPMGASLQAVRGMNVRGQEIFHVSWNGKAGHLLSSPAIQVVYA